MYKIKTEAINIDNRMVGWSFTCPICNEQENKYWDGVVLHAGDKHRMFVEATLQHLSCIIKQSIKEILDESSK